MTLQGYLLAPDIKLNALKAMLQKQLGCVARRPHSYACYYLDSLDRRLYQQHLYLQADQLENGIHLQLFSLATHKLLSQTLCERLPNSVKELPNSRLLTLLRPILENRSIIPLLKLKITRHPMEIVDTEQKNIAQLNLEIAQLTSPKPRQIARTLWYHTVQNDQKISQKIKQALAQQTAISLMQQSQFEQILSQITLQPQHSLSKPVIPLHPQQRSDDALRALLSYLIEIAESQRPCTLQDLDPECLHSIRIAARRSRSLLSALPQVIPQRQQHRLLKGFKKLGDVTTPLRDLDIILQQFSNYRSLLPLKKRHALEPVRQQVLQQRQHAHLALCKYLNSYAYRQFINGTQRYLQAPLPTRTPLLNAQRPILQLADERIWKAYKKVITAGKSIDQHSAPEALHTLRKQCKKLRYLMELFSTLYPESKLKQLIKILKKLQDNLGEYQDLNVHIKHLDTLHNEMSNAHKVDKKLTHAFKQIHHLLEEKQVECRSHFLSYFADFNTSRNRHRFEQLFKAQK